MKASSAQKQGFHYGYLIVLSCMFICFGPCALALSCPGIFFAPVSSSIGIDPGMTSYYMTALFAGSTVATPLSGRFLQDKDARLCITVCAVIAAAVFFAQSFTMSLPYFLACGFLMGLTVPTLMYLATPVLVNRWFTKRAGFFIGLAMAFTGIGGVVFNPIGTFIITGFGWEMAYRAFAVIALVLTLPFSLFVVRSNPSDKGLLPYGAEDAPAAEGAASAAAVSGMRAEDAFRSKELIFAFVWGLLVNLCMYAYTVTATYVGEMQIAGVSDAVAFAGIAASVVMAGQTIGKVVFGGIGDKSPQLCIILGLGAGVVGLLTYQFVSATQPSIFIAAFLVGLFASVATVAPPIVARRLFGTLDYSRIWGRLSMATTIGGMVMALIWGTLRTVTGSWAAMFIIEAIILAFCIAFGLLVIGFAPRLRKRWVTQDTSEK